jgi:hypothetical protein
MQRTRQEVKTEMKGFYSRAVALPPSSCAVPANATDHAREPQYFAETKKAKTRWASSCWPQHGHSTQKTVGRAASAGILCIKESMSLLSIDAPSLNIVKVVQVSLPFRLLM